MTVDGPIRYEKKASRQYLIRMYLLAVQGEKCALCGCHVGRFNSVLDHDHATGFIRGIVCSLCNHLMAGFEKMQRNGVPVERIAEYAQPVIFPAEMRSIGMDSDHGPRINGVPFH